MASSKLIIPVAIGGIMLAYLLLSEEEENDTLPEYEPLPAPPDGYRAARPVAVLPTRETFAPTDSPRKIPPRLITPKHGSVSSGINARDVLSATNQTRARGACGYSPAVALVWNDQLAAAAAAHARDMADKGYFNHVGLDGLSPTQRIAAAGFRGQMTGENIAAGQDSVTEVIQGWINSPGHCKNLMMPSYRQLGVGYYFTPNGQYHHYWVQNFGS